MKSVLTFVVGNEGHARTGFIFIARYYDRIDVSCRGGRILPEFTSCETERPNVEDFSVPGYVRGDRLCWVYGRGRKY